MAEVRFARRAIKSTALAVHGNCDFPSECRADLQAKFSNSQTLKVSNSETLRLSKSQTLKLSIYQNSQSCKVSNSETLTLSDYWNLGISIFQIPKRSDSQTLEL